jgi:hypothetical protein
MADSTFVLHRLTSPLRWPFIVAAVVAAVAHIPVIAPHLEEAPYMGGLFIALTVGCLTLAASAVAWDSPAVYGAAIVTCGLAVIGYVATRVVAFPMLADDVGNWLEPLGVVSIVAETAVVAISLAALREASRAARRAPAVPAAAAR